MITLNLERLRIIRQAALHYQQDKAITKRLFAEVVTLTSEQERAQYVQALFLDLLKDWEKLEVDQLTGESCEDGECRL